MKKRKRDPLRIAFKRAESYPPGIGMGEIVWLSKSKDGRDRLLSLVLMRREIAEGDDAWDYFHLAQGMIEDGNSHCCGQALSIIADCVETHPDAVWEVVNKYGDSQDEDTQIAIACFLLEHLLEVDFKKYFALVRNEVTNGRLRFLRTLGACWFFGDDRKERKVENYIRNTTRGLPESDIP